MTSDYRMEESLLGMELISGVFRIRVESRGATKKSHFEIDVVAIGDNDSSPYRITVYRVLADAGSNNVVGGIELEYEYQELRTNLGRNPKAGDDIIVENLFTMR